MADSLTLQPKKEPEKKSDFPGSASMLMSGLAALALTGVYFVTRNKKTTSIVQNEKQQEIQKVNKCSVKIFKNLGHKFEKGIAKYSDGELFSGVLFNKSFILQYKDGVLYNVSKYTRKSKKLIYSKNYQYINGQLFSIIKNDKPLLEINRKSNFDTYKIGSTYLRKDNEGNMYLEKNYNDDCLLKTIKYYRNGKLSIESNGPFIYHVYADDGKTKLFSKINGKIINYDDNADVVDKAV